MLRILIPSALLHPLCILKYDSISRKGVLLLYLKQFRSHLKVETRRTYSLKKYWSSRILLHIKKLLRQIWTASKSVLGLIPVSTTIINLFVLTWQNSY